MARASSALPTFARLNAVGPHVESTGHHVVVAADGGDDHRQIGRLVEAQHPLELIVAEAGMLHVEQSVFAAGGLKICPTPGLSNSITNEPNLGCLVPIIARKAPLGIAAYPFRRPPSAAFRSPMPRASVSRSSHTSPE